MHVKQFKYSMDNLGYLVFSKKTAVAIDPGAVDEMIQFARKKDLNIAYVTNTHSHHDHTIGNSAMLEKTGAKFLNNQGFSSGQIILLDDEKLEVIKTPGHTKHDVTFKADDFIITGDTLFNGTVGNCFSGDLKAFFKSLSFLISLPGNTRVFAGHDYVRESISIARGIERNNPNLDKFLEKYDPDFVVSTIEDELNTNPYIRFNAPEMMELIKQTGRSHETEFERFKAVMEVF